MTPSEFPLPGLPADGSVLDPESVFVRALVARDARFDGVFFVGITSTRVYCRPICPARVSYNDHRRFFRSAAGAERAGFRPCLRCRPELAPGRAACEAVARLAHAAAGRIAAGALNGRSVVELARDLGVSERHLRRALEEEIGVSPLELALTHRLLLARRLLADTVLPVTRVAYASGFQSLRRFNDAFRAHYRVAPSAVRRPRVLSSSGSSGNDAASALSTDPLGAAALRLSLAYRPPLAWDALLAVLGRDAVAGIDLVDGRRYARTLRIDGHAGVVMVEDIASQTARGDRTSRGHTSHLVARVSASLVPMLMPVLAQLRHLLDLDAEPAAIDAHLTEGGLGPLVALRPGLRVPGAVDGFDVALRVILGERAALVVDALGERIETSVRGLDRLPPAPEAIAAAGIDRLVGLGVRRRQAQSLVGLAVSIVDGKLRLEPGRGIAATHRALLAISGIGTITATTIIARTLDWPDALATTDRALIARADSWRPWRAYAALHLRLAGPKAAAFLSHSREAGYVRRRATS